MGRDSKIEWTDHTFNPWIGCTKVSPGCKHCYAETRMDHRFGRVKWGPGQERKRTSAANWKLPVRWNKEAEGAARRPRVFCASLADVFDPEVPTAWRAELLTLIDDTPNLDWLLLTKRPELVRDLLMESSNGNMWDFRHMPNVWLGTTVENQQSADERIRHLLGVWARVRFLSCEPLLGPVQLGIRAGDGFSFFDYGLGAGFGHVDWVIAGGESGPGARPMHPEWARSLRDQCAAARVPFLFKQWGEWKPISQMSEDETNALYRSRRLAGDDEDQCHLDEIYGRTCTVPTLVLGVDGEHLSNTAPSAWLSERLPMLAFRVGKAAAGRTLDGVIHDGYPGDAT